MVITKTPFRMSFFGGGTDYKDFFNEYGGSVIETTIDKYCYVSAKNFLSILNMRIKLSIQK